MRISLFLAADYANATPDGKLNVMGIFNMINATNFPIRHGSLFVILKLIAELGEYGQTRNLHVKLQDPNGSEIMSLSGQVTIPQPEGGKTPEVNAIFELKDIIFPKEGPYQFVVLVDKDFKGDLPLYVNKIELPTLKSG